MKLNQIIHSYLKALYYINNRLNHRYSKHSTLDPFIQHRVAMDLEIAKSIIERELVHIATYSCLPIPTLRNRKSRSNISSLTSTTNQLLSMLVFRTEFDSIDTVVYNSVNRYHKLFNDILRSSVHSTTRYKYSLRCKLPYITYTKLHTFYNRSI